MSLFTPTTALEPFLERLTSRSPLGEAERRAILLLPGYKVQVQSNRDLVRLGERVDHACLVTEGLVGRFGQNKDGERQITALHIPGDMADLHSVVSPQVTSALQTLAATTVLKVPHAALREAAHRYPAIAEAFWRDCMIDAAVLSEWLVNIGRRQAASRAAHLLCEMACRYEAAGSGAGFSFAFPVTQTHFADMLALTPVHVNRTFKTLRMNGLVNIYDKQVEILDWDRTASLGEFDPTYLQIATVAEEEADMRHPSPMAG